MWGLMTEKPQNITINRGSTTTVPVSALWRILPPLGRSGSPSPGVGRYCPVKTATLSEFPSTPDTFVRLEESIGGMPMSPSGCGVDDNLTIDDHNEVDARSRRCSHIPGLSLRRRRIMILDKFWRVGWQRQEEGIEVRCLCKIGRHRRSRHHRRGRVQKQAYEGGYMATIWSLSKVRM